MAKKRGTGRPGGELWRGCPALDLLHCSPFIFRLWLLTSVSDLSPAS